MAKSTNLLRSDDESGESGLRLRRNDSWTPTYPSVVPPPFEGISNRQRVSSLTEFRSAKSNTLA